MNEREGYGKKIYRQRKKPALYIVLVFLFLAASFAFFYYLGKQKTSIDLVNTGTVGKREAVDTAAPVSDPSPRKYPQEYRHEDQGKPGTNPIQPGNLPQAAPALKNLPLSPQVTEEPRDDFSLAGDYYLKRDYRKALELYTRASTTDKRAVVYVGLCYYWLEDYNNALIFFREALDYNRLDFIAGKFIALAYYQLNDLENSLVYAKKALEAMKDIEIEDLQARLVEEKKVMKSFDVTDTRQFKVFFSRNEHQEIERSIVDILKAAHREIGTKMDFYPSAPVSVILYNEKDFFDVTRSPGWAGGLYDGKIRLPIAGIEDADYNTLKRILFHEYAHALVHAITPQCPVWINEGLAMYFSGDIGGKIGQVIPLDKLEKGFPLEESAVVIAYLESYSAVSYLIERYRIYGVKELLKAFGRGEDIKAAFNTALMISYDRFIKTWGKD